ncbi:MAG: hypothetical protein V5A59_13710 [Bacteroidales bacterium]
MRHKVKFTAAIIIMLGLFSSCDEEVLENRPDVGSDRTAASLADYSEMVEFKTTKSNPEGMVYEVLPGPAAIDPSKKGTPFSNNIHQTGGSYEFGVVDVNETDAVDSKDSVKNVDIRFTGNDGRKYAIDQINVIHKPEGSGDHTFFGGVGLNKVMHGNTGIGEDLMPRLLSYITLWGKTNLKDANTGDVIAEDRLIHIMTTTNVRDEDLNLITSTEVDSSDYNIREAHTHVILPPKDTKGNMSPVPGTDHGFLHMMFEKVTLTDASRDWKKAFEILPGPAAINPQMSPTPFSNKIGVGAGNYNLLVLDLDDKDSEDSRDRVNKVNIQYKRPNGTMFRIDDIDIIHKPEGAGDHTFFGGVGYNKTMHGNTGIGTGLMPKLKSYITLWGKADLKDGQGNVLASDRLIHLMVTSRVRKDDLTLITSTDTDETDHSRNETHIMLPPKDMQGNPSPVPGTRHGFLHLMFEDVEVRTN